MSDSGPIARHDFDTVLGRMIACATDRGLCLLEFAERPILEKEFADLTRLLRAPIVDTAHEYTQETERQINAWFAGERLTFDLPLHMPGTAFQQQVWQALLALPYGATASYQQQAARIGRPDAVRAVGAANGQNRLAVIVPCHRVFAKNGALTGYGGGIERKRWLLAHEAACLARQQSQA
ncbi:AraC family transcriptional regulator of adaptative response/methylated-DNA-[protein]-cysteine methyltransferase [Silvimonas terrae]|uniref:Methylated-DNA--protein-cysteine methyltransferase n=1 Tax=Silvimonas terrae TaxID=300266 RepID=A0A840RK27_9NEIS|nr:methylated-DNA--[protein]-cysteine S-methyltransferase [Silvimonas terrae]MBB5192592.1 AraC family transcriptional regulator of adaptative response/methylated-DNA-[protein]-cysteine methyltransferase [Silvimonas terrae]